MDSESDDDSAVAAFAVVDFSGVNFDVDAVVDDDENNNERLIEWEDRIAFQDSLTDDYHGLTELGKLLEEGRYIEILQDTNATIEKMMHEGSPSSSSSVYRFLQERVIENGADSVKACIELEIVGIAALNVFLQSNYTGPTLEDSALRGINPHPIFENHLKLHNSNYDTVDEEKKGSLATRTRKTSYQNAVLAELAVDGNWPCQVCYNPYFLLIARAILSTLSNPTEQIGNENRTENLEMFIQNASKLHAVNIWNGRAIVAHERLLQARQPSTTLWKEAEVTFKRCTEFYCSLPESSTSTNERAAVVMLEWGLAQHHFDRPGKGKKSFERAKTLSGMEMEVTGSLGKRTKFQQKATAQMVVRAKSAVEPTVNDTAGDQKDLVKEQMIEHSEDGILLERVKFEEDKDNQIENLNILDQSILLALCLDVKNNNPNDGLTGEQMGAFLARVLDHHDDWMVYSTSLLERSWLEFERSHARERAILQLQALADQHTNRLTITQSTRKSIEDSAPVQHRLKHLHGIVYPPRWLMIQDLAERYAALGIVTSAAELFTEIELWDSVVECYRRAGRVSFAEKIVRERLAVEETPRMWAALGDLTKDPSHYEKAVELSNGRFADAFLALAEHYCTKGDLVSSAEYFDKALKVRPLNPAAWFRCGTINMQLKRWQVALKAFSEVVMQEPEESDAWANIAAIHMHDKQPSEAYPALNESLKYQRSNWRVWVSKLYTCLDLEKYDEAIQACNVLLDLRSEKASSDGVPFLEEKCVRAIVGGTLKKFHESKGDEIALDSSRRTLSRVYALLDRISSSSDSAEHTWVFETMAFFQEQTGQDSEKILDALTKEYRSLQAISGWEKDNHMVRKICQVASHMANIYMKDGYQGLVKARFLVQGILQKLKSTRPDDKTLPTEASRLSELLTTVEKELSENLNS